MLCTIYVYSIYNLQPPFDIAGDAPGYLEAMRVLAGNPAPEIFTPNRILTTFLGLAPITLLSVLTGNYLASWMFINSLYFFGLAFASYSLFRAVTRSEAGSVLGALFVVGNYDVVVFGLNYLMDITGWFWFVASLYFLWRHMEGGEQRFVWYAAFAAGLGGLCKEYAYFAFVPFGLYFIYLYWNAPLKLARAAVPALLALVPTALVHLGVYLVYGYSYLDWYGMNTSTFAFEGWLWNTTRSFLVVLSFMLPITLLGIYAFVQEMRQSFDVKRVVFVLTLTLPALAVLLWPIITERLVFLVVPLASLMAAYGIKRYERYWPWFGLVFLAYFFLALKTDGWILNYLYAL